MAIAYNIIDIRGKASENVIAEILFQNKTISEGYVTFEEEVKNEVIFTEGTTSVSMQAYTSGVPTTGGSLNVFDVSINPAKYMYYQTFDPNTLRPSRFKRDMKAGAWEVLSSEFERVVIGGMYADRISYDAELKFWSGITSAKQSAIAGLTAGTANTSIGADEKTVAAALTAGQIDGVVASMMYNAWNSTLTAGVGTRIKVDGAVITSANIQDETEKVYKVIPAELLASATQPVIYMPHVNKQFINSNNNIVTNYKQAFVVSGNKYFYNDVEIIFVPIPANVMIAMPKQHVYWVTDLTSDINKVEINKTALNADLMFIKHVGTLACYVANQAYNVLYCGS